MLPAATSRDAVSAILTSTGLVPAERALNTKTLTCASVPHDPESYPLCRDR